VSIVVELLEELDEDDVVIHVREELLTELPLR
jgi:hypothetical protein